MEIELWSGVTKAIIDPFGAWMTNLSDDRGDILFPKRSLKNDEGAVKLRGGCHVCLPNFGPGGSSGLTQHGFGREKLWSVREQKADTVVLELVGLEGEYASMHAVISYVLENAVLTVMLEVINSGTADLRIAPAFHPYFGLLGVKNAVVNGEEQLLDELVEARFTTADSMQLTTQSRTITLQSQLLPVWATWTDQLGSYICIEPTAGGFTFLRDTPSTKELLGPGESKKYSLKVAWS